MAPQCHSVQQKTGVYNISRSNLSSELIKVEGKLRRIKNEICQRLCIFPNDLKKWHNFHCSEVLAFYKWKSC